MSDAARRTVDRIPVVLFLIFAGFWSGSAVISGIPLAVLPSALVLVVLLGHAGLSRREDTP